MSREFFPQCVPGNLWSREIRETCPSPRFLHCFPNKPHRQWLHSRQPQDHYNHSNMFPAKTLHSFSGVQCHTSSHGPRGVCRSLGRMTLATFFWNSCQSHQHREWAARELWMGASIVASITIRVYAQANEYRHTLGLRSMTGMSVGTRNGHKCGGSKGEGQGSGAYGT